MNYFIDGDFKNPIENDSDQDHFYSSAYSSKNKNYIAITLGKAVQNKINTSAFKEVISFYNKKEKVFKEFEKEMGINMWFFEHFRLFFAYRNFQLRIACINDFLRLNPNGIVISNDSKLKNIVDVNNFRLISNSNKQPENKKKKALTELTFIVKHFKWRYKQEQKNLIISRIEDNINGSDFRFGDLELSCDKMLNRDIFNPERTFPRKELSYRTSRNVDALFARYILSLSGVKSVFKFRKQLRTLFQQLDSQNTIKETIILDLFKKNHLSYFVYYLKYRSFNKLFNKTTYNGVVMINENSAQQKAIQYAAIQNNVKIFALQHGAIYDTHPAYMYGDYVNPPILPTVTFTWGKYFTDLLTTKGGYQKKQVITSGRIPLIVDSKAHAALNTEKEIIVYATQPQPNLDQRIKELKDVFLAVKNLTDRYLLVIRPHPAENDDHFFDQVAKSIDFEKFIIDRVSDLKTHFEHCSLLITSYSTVGAEFIPYYKPLLVLDYLKSDRVNYIKLGVGIPIYDKEMLIKTLEKTKLAIDNESYSSFVENYFYESGEKAIEIIQKEINK